jgi:hypothetical protein
MIHQQGSWTTFLVKKKCQEDKTNAIKETLESIKEDIEDKSTSRPHK